MHKCIFGVVYILYLYTIGFNPAGPSNAGPINAGPTNAGPTNAGPTTLAPISPTPINVNCPHWSKKPSGIKVYNVSIVLMHLCFVSTFNSMRIENQGTHVIWCFEYVTVMLGSARIFGYVSKNGEVFGVLCTVWDESDIIGADCWLKDSMKCVEKFNLLIRFLLTVVQKWIFKKGWWKATGGVANACHKETWKQQMRSTYTTLCIDEVYSSYWHWKLNDRHFLQHLTCRLENIQQTLQTYLAVNSKNRQKHQQNV